MPFEPLILLLIVPLWLAALTVVVALCTTAARSDRAQEAQTLGELRVRRAAASAEVRGGERIPGGTVEQERPRGPRRRARRGSRLAA